MQIRSVVLGVAVLFAGWIAGAPSAWAHAVLQSSVPVANSIVDSKTVDAGHFAIVLKFNSRIDAAHSSLALLGQDGKSMALTVDAKAAANVLSSTAFPIKPGHYAVHWQVVASDGHISRGAVPFDVR